ncbi:MAG: hypothetical protein ACK52V_14810 [Betaproteobacteria bacterium]
MANQLATVSAARAAIPQTLVAGTQAGGEMFPLFSTLTNPAAGGVVVGENISWGTLPLGARVLMGYLTCSAGTASSTLNLGDRATPARYLAATSVASATNIAINPPVSNANGAAGFVTNVSAPGLATDTCEILSVCAGANIAANQTLTLFLLCATNG